MNKRKEYRRLSLVEILEKYKTTHQLCRKHETNMRSRLQKFQDFCGQRLTLAAITEDHINEFLIHLEQLEKAPSTIRGFRTCIITMLKFAGWTGHFGDVRRVKLKQRVVEGWNLNQVRRLLGVARTLTGYLENGVSRQDFWMAAIHAGYSTGLRWGDLRYVPVKKISRNGVCQVVQSKTGRLVTVRFSRKAMHWITSHGQDVVLPCPYSQKWFCENFARLVERAEIPGGSFKWLRRTASSYADAEKRGNGRLLLGHASETIFDTHYNVQAITNKEPVEPTPL